MIDWFDKFWELYINAFPEDERRCKDAQTEVFNNPLYNAESIMHKDKWAGFLTWWDLSDMVYIEYFAVDSCFRNNGLGGKFLRSFLSKTSKCVVLEVEPPTDELTVKRVDFYKRLGFMLLEGDYEQPAYDASKQPVSLKLMVYKPAPNTDFQYIKDSLYETVYKR